MGDTKELAPGPMSAKVHPISGPASPSKKGGSKSALKRRKTEHSTSSGTRLQVAQVNFPDVEQKVWWKRILEHSDMYVDGGC